MPDRKPDAPSEPPMKTPAGYEQVSNAGWVQYEAPDYSGKNISGWKVQVSVAPEDLPKAWNLLADYLPESGVQVVKVAKPSILADHGNPEDGQSGKMIVIYDTKLPGWDKRALEIEQLLQAGGIKPGPEVKDSRRIEGSQYTFYVHDGGHELGGYRKAVSRRTHHESLRHNIAGKTDPFKDIDVASAYGETSTPLERAIEQKVREGQVETKSGKARFTGSMKELQQLKVRFDGAKIRTSIGVSSLETSLRMPDPENAPAFLDVMPKSAARVQEMLDKAKCKIGR